MVEVIGQNNKKIVKKLLKSMFSENWELFKGLWQFRKHLFKEKGWFLVIAVSFLIFTCLIPISYCKNP